MFKTNSVRRVAMLLILLALTSVVFAQNWSKDGNGYYTKNNNEIVLHAFAGKDSTILADAKMLTPKGATQALEIQSFSLSEDGKKVLLFTNAQKVWRLKTRGDYWVLDLTSKALKKLGKGRPEATLMFAKFSPDGKKVAYVSERNIYVEDLATGAIKKLTSDNGTPKLINGTFDWAYEEEFFCRDGFRWAPNGQTIAYWQIDANKIRDFYLINNTDSIYSQIIPIEYPKAGQPPSPARIGVVNITSGKTVWMNVPGDAAQHYIPRMEWTPDGKEIILQQLNRKQNESKLMLCNPASGAAKTIFTEKDDAWVATINEWSSDVTGWDWIDKGNAFVWTSEQDGWRHLYRIGRDGKSDLLTKGDYDVIETLLIDEPNQMIYFHASPENATQQYLYEVPLDGKSDLKLLSPAAEKGTHNYQISPNGKYAFHTFSNYYTQPLREKITLPDHKPLPGEESIASKVSAEAPANSNVSFFKVTTEDGVQMDGWMMKPYDFDPKKKYPVVFYVYGEPAATTVNDSYYGPSGFIYAGDMAADGYIHVSLDNRGTPAPKGRAWRKSIYGKIGQINIRDQAMGAKKLLESNTFMDASRVAVWGWSGGGSSTLNLLFQYPDIYKTGIAIAPVTASYLYDNIYTERYMGLPDENAEGYKNGAALTYAKNLEGNLLLIHGTGDDNVHFQNSEMLVNELIKNGKQFMFMPYPNRTHSISEGAGTFQHLATLVSNYLRANCPPGAKEVKP